VSEATGLAAIAREADLWRELAEIRGKLASPALATRHLRAREDLVLRRLRELGVNTRSLLACERFTRHMLVTYEEARAVRAFIKSGSPDEVEAHVLGALLGRIIVELDGMLVEDDEPETKPS
jgi:hypothetical protein